MEFFVPNVSEKGQEDFWQGIRKNAQASTGRPATDRRIFKITFTDKGKLRTVEVGERDEVVNETVAAILEAGDVYLVCTTNRGVAQDAPILVGKDAIVSITDFEAPVRPRP